MHMNLTCSKIAKLELTTLAAFLNPSPVPCTLRARLASAPTSRRFASRSSGYWIAVRVHKQSANVSEAASSRTVRTPDPSRILCQVPLRIACSNRFNSPLGASTIRRRPADPGRYEAISDLVVPRHLRPPAPGLAMHAIWEPTVAWKMTGRLPLAQSVKDLAIQFGCVPPGTYIPRPNDFVRNPRVLVLNGAMPAGLFGMTFTPSTQPVMNAEIARVNLVNAAVAAAVKAAHPEIIIVQTVGFSALTDLTANLFAYLGANVELPTYLVLPSRSPARGCIGTDMLELFTGYYDCPITDPAAFPSINAKVSLNSGIMTGYRLRVWGDNQTYPLTGGNEDTAITALNAKKTASYAQLQASVASTSEVADVRFNGPASGYAFASAIAAINAAWGLSLQGG